MDEQTRPQTPEKPKKEKKGKKRTALSRKYRWKIFSATRPSFWTRRITAAAVFGAQEQKS